MASCNECICSEVCYYKSFNDVRALKKRRNDVEKVCKSFVNRDAVEVVHGRWEILDFAGYMMCSVCGKIMDEDYNYCPNCGAKMDGDGNG